jgi:2-oxoglutarate ferredoxin oxidoreductase subunit alpha
MAESYLTDDADIIIVAFGAAARIAKTAINKARAAGIKVGLIRPITLWPFPVSAIEAAIPNARSFLSVEFSTGQMVDDVRLAVAGRVPVSFFGHAGGIVPTPDEVLVAINKANAGEVFDILPFHSQLTGGGAQ